MSHPTFPISHILISFFGRRLQSASPRQPSSTGRGLSGEKGRKGWARVARKGGHHTEAQLRPPRRDLKRPQERRPDAQIVRRHARARPLQGGLPRIRHQIQKRKKLIKMLRSPTARARGSSACENTFFSLSLNVAPPLLPYVQNLIHSSGIPAHSHRPERSARFGSHCTLSSPCCHTRPFFSCHTRVVPFL